MGANSGVSIGLNVGWEEESCATIRDIIDTATLHLEVATNNAAMIHTNIQCVKPTLQCYTPLIYFVTYETERNLHAYTILPSKKASNIFFAKYAHIVMVQHIITVEQQPAFHRDNPSPLPHLQILYPMIHLHGQCAWNCRGR